MTTQNEKELATETEEALMDPDERAVRQIQEHISRTLNDAIGTKAGGLEKQIKTLAASASRAAVVSATVGDYEVTVEETGTADASGRFHYNVTVKPAK